MKVLQVINHFYPCIGGMEEVAKAISENLVREKVEVKVICLNKCSKGKEKLDSKEFWNGIEIERMNFLDLRFYKIAPQILFKLKDADILHVHGMGFFSDFLLFTKPVHRKKIVLHTHGAVFHTNQKSLFKRIYFFICQRFLLKFADRIIAVSKQDLELFSKIACRKKIILMENGINLKEFRIGKKVSERFLFVGRISRNKRIDLLLQVFAKVAKTIPDAKLIIIGEDWENLQAGLQKLSNELGIKKNVEFLGKLERTQILGHYASAKYFVSASEYEGFGIAVLEACASGCIPLLNRINAFENILGKESELLIDYANAEKASEQILKIVKKNEDQKNSIRKNCYAIALKFDWKEKVKKLIKEYEIVLKQ